MTEQADGFFPQGTVPTDNKPAQASGGIFKKDAPQAPGIDFNQISNEVNNISRRLRIIEERYINIRNKTQVTDQNMLAGNKRINTNLKENEDEVKDVKKDLNEIKDKIKIVIKELQLCAKKEQVDVLQKYINFWEPLNFVTENQVEKMIKDALEEELNKR